MFKGNRSRSTGQRTAEEREQARQERERRRAGISGGMVSAQSTPGDEPAVATPVAAVEQNLPDDEPAALEVPLDSVGTEPPSDELPTETPGAVVAQEPPDDEPVAVVLVEEWMQEQPAIEHDHTQMHAPPTEELHELAPAESMTRSPAPAVVGMPTLPPPLTTQARKQSLLTASKANKPRRRMPARLGALVALLAAIAAVWLLAQTLSSGSNHHRVVARPSVVKVVIPEGVTRRQIATIAKAEGMRGSYLVASRSSSLLPLTDYGVPRSTSTLEGFLFPATYEVFAGAAAKRLVDEQLAAFRENFGSQEIHRAHVLHVTPYQLLTVASMIEREAEVERYRPLIAAVIYNRLRLGMTLGIDATIRYALNDYSKPLTETQLKSPSAYNTRVHTGLPPTPIGNPGVASIHAAAHPAHVSYLYYVAAADGCGAQVFSTSYAKFEKDAAAYHEALARNHGRVPTCRRK